MKIFPDVDDWAYVLGRLVIAYLGRFFALCAQSTPETL